MYQYRSKRILLLFPAGCPSSPSAPFFFFSASAYFQLLRCAPIRLRARNVRLAGRISSVSRKTTSWLLRRHLPPVSSESSVFGLFRSRGTGFLWPTMNMLGRTRISFVESIETTWQSEKASADRVTVSAGESDVLLRFIEKRRSFIDDPIAGRSGIQFRESGTPVANNSVSLSRHSSSCEKTAFLRSLAFYSVILI